MSFIQSRLYLISILLFLGLLAAPRAIHAAVHSADADSSIYLPLISNSGGTGGILTNGGSVEGDGGVGLGALSASLSAPVAVTITQTSAPTETLPVQAQALSDYFRISARSDVYVSTEKPLILAVPIPAGADTAHLAVAILQANESINDADGSMATWTFLEGAVDPVKDLFLTTISALKSTGNAATLVADPDFDSPLVASPSELPRAASSGPVQFDVICLNFTQSADCTATTESEISTYLSDIYAHIQGDLRYNPPRLRNQAEQLSYIPNAFTSSGYVAYIEPNNTGYCKSASAGGYYTAISGRLVLCLNPAVGLNYDYVHILIHEYFHATQHGNAQTFFDYLGDQAETWIIEGTAKSAEESYFVPEMLRSEIGGWVQLHKVDIPLKSDAGSDEYFAQDYWVYYGQLKGVGLPYLEGILEQGATAEDVVNVLGDGNYLDTYWDWAKNQAMEASIDLGGTLGTPCTLNSEVVNQLVDFNFVWPSQTVQLVTLDPLDSAVVEISWDNPYNLADGFVTPVDLSDSDAWSALKYKFYQDGEAGCEIVPDGNRTFINVDPGAHYYVVISNIDYDQPYDYRVSFEVSPIPAP